MPRCILSRCANSHSRPLTSDPVVVIEPGGIELFFLVKFCCEIGRAHLQVFSDLGEKTRFMAIYHLHVKIISSGAGRSAVAAAAYRHGTEMESEKTGERFNYGRKSDVAHTEVLLPMDAPAWAREAFSTENQHQNSERLWNHFEVAATHKNARYAQEFEVALPKQLNRKQQIALVQKFVKIFTDADRVVDFAIHEAPGNPHVHIMVTARQLTDTGWGPAGIKILDENGQIQYRGKGANRRVLEEPVTGSTDRLIEWRKSWADLTNEALEGAGLDQRVDHRSFKDRGIDLLPNQKRGPATDRCARKDLPSNRLDMLASTQAENIRRLIADPARILPLLCEVSDTVTSEQIEEVLKRYVSPEDTRRNLLVDIFKLPELIEVKRGYKNHPSLYSVRDAIGQAKVEQTMANPEKVIAEINGKRAVFTNQDIEKHLVKKGLIKSERRAVLSSTQLYQSIEQLSETQTDPDGKIQPAAYTTHAFRKIERELISGAETLTFKRHHPVWESAVVRAIEEVSASTGITYSPEQREAIGRMLDPAGLVVLEGYAGTGKSTLFDACKRVWEESGYRVRGTAVAAKAALELQQSSGIKGQTLYSLLQEIRTGTADIGRQDIIVLDEAGMVGSRDMHVLVEAVQKGGAKLVLAGDRNQLSPISAGAPFRNIADRSRSLIQVEHIRRQRNDDHRRASQHLARGEVEQALAIYRAEGSIHAAPTHAAAVENMGAAIASDIMAGVETLGLAHRNTDVEAVNFAARKVLLKKGHLKPGQLIGPEGNRREISVGEQLVFLKNDRDRDVTNGTLFKVEAVSLTSIRGTVRGDKGPRTITINPQTYTDFDYAYAVTIHKFQGVSVENAHVFAYPSMTRNLTYVAMTRHKKSVSMHYDEKAFPKGLETTLSRHDRKTSTLDYADELQDRIEFGERYGLDTYGFFKRVAQAITGFIKRLAGQITPSAEIASEPKDRPAAVPAKPIDAQPRRRAEKPGKYLAKPVAEFSKSAVTVAYSAIIKEYRQSSHLKDVKSAIRRNYPHDEGKALYGIFWRGPTGSDWNETVAKISDKIENSYEQIDVPRYNLFNKQRIQECLEQNEAAKKAATAKAHVFQQAAQKARKDYESLFSPKYREVNEDRKLLSLGVLRPEPEVLSFYSRLCAPAELEGPSETSLHEATAELSDSIYGGLKLFHAELKKYGAASARLKAVLPNDVPAQPALMDLADEANIDLAGKRLLEAGHIRRQIRWTQQKSSSLSM